MARADREQHKAKYPGWSARENYAVHKRKKKRRDKSEGKECLLLGVCVIGGVWSSARIPFWDFEA